MPRSKTGQFHTIITHRGAHLDEYLAVYLLQQFGEEKFPGIEAGRIIFWSTGGLTPDGRSTEEWEADGCILIGVGGSRFDEHPFGGNSRRKNKCAADLVAEYLGVDQLPELKKLLDYARCTDLSATSTPFELASLIKSLNNVYGDEPQLVAECVLTIIEAIHEDQEQFWVDAPREFAKQATTQFIPGPDGTSFKLVVVDGNQNPQMMKFVRSKHGGSADVIIKREPSGNVQIGINHQTVKTLQKVAVLIRLAELRLQGLSADLDQLHTMGREGRVDGVLHWWYMGKDGEMLLNGCLTAPDVPPTKLPLPTIIDCVRRGLAPPGTYPAPR